MRKPYVLCCQSSFDYEDPRFIIEFVPVIQTIPYDIDVATLSNQYDWLLFTSKHAVHHFVDYLPDVTFNKIASIGASTTRTIQAYGYPVHFEASVFTQEGFISSFHVERESRILYPASVKRRNHLERFLSSKGVIVETLDLYEPIENMDAVHYFRRALARADVITFSSPSGVRAVINALSTDEKALLLTKKVIAIGPVTQKALNTENIRSTYPSVHTTEAMFEEIMKTMEV